MLILLTLSLSKAIAKIQIFCDMAKYIFRNPMKRRTFAGERNNLSNTMKRLVLLLMTLLPLALSAQTVTTMETDSLRRSDDISLDYAVLRYLQDHRTPAGNRVWLAISNSVALAPVPAAGIAVNALCTNDPLEREHSLYDAGEATASELLNLGVTMGTKAIVRRPRPWVAYEGDLVCLQPVRSTSFPSGHTSIAFATATSLTLVYPRWYIALPAYLWAGAVGFSRMYVGAHYPSDVLAGALVGTGTALLVHYIRQRVWQQSGHPTPAAAIVVPVSFSF